MENVEKDISEEQKKDKVFPEVLEFLKSCRTINKQLKLFKNTEIPEGQIMVIKKAAAKVQRQIETFITDDEKGA